MNQAEKEVLRDCREVLDLLKSRGALDYWRVSMGGVKRGAYLTPNHDMIGFSDIIILLPIPRSLFVEVKRLKGVQSEEQIEFQKRIEAMNHRYYLCKSRENLIEILIENSVPTHLYFR